MKHPILSSLAALVVVLPFSVTQAQVIYWNFGGTSTTTTLAPSTDTIATFNSSSISSHNITPIDAVAVTSPSTGYTISVGDFTTAASGEGNPYGNVFVPGVFDSTASSYWEFTLTPTAGNAVSLAYLAFGGRAIVNPATPTSYSLRSSLDGYATAVADGAFNLTSTAWRLYEENFNVAGAVDQAVTFRLYLLGGDGSSRTGALRIDDVTISTVPEPSTYALIVIGLCAILFARRRRSLRPCYSSR